MKLSTLDRVIKDREKWKNKYKEAAFFWLRAERKLEQIEHCELILSREIRALMRDREWFFDCVGANDKGEPCGLRSEKLKRAIERLGERLVWLEAKWDDKL